MLLCLSIFLLALYFVVTPFIYSSLTPVYANPAWSGFYFTFVLYVLFFFSALLYLVPNMSTYTRASNFSTGSSFESVDGPSLVKLLVTPIALILLAHFAWSGPAVTAWFGHITFSSFQYKVTPLLLLIFVSYLTVVATNVHYSTTQVYDFTSTLFSFVTWLWLLFFSNNLFTFIFFLELLSALVMLLLITSTFSSSHLYNTLQHSNASYFQTSTPTAFLQTLLMFFWTTLVASLLLFTFTMVFYLQLLTFDWNITGALFNFLVVTSSLKTVFNLAFMWLLMLLCIFLKCGIVPFYLWKPAFFRGMTLLSLFFYVYIYYFAIFLYFVYVIFFQLNELFAFNIYIVTLLLVAGTLLLSTILFESLYLKAFLALSSILNSLLIFYALCSLQICDIVFVI